MTADLSNLVVEILHNRGDDKHPDWSVGSGFFVGTSLVLTAFHNVDGQGELLVRVHGKEEHPAIVSLQGDNDMDLAVLEVSDVAVDVPPLRYGVVDRSVPAVVERCWAIGFPRFKERVHDPKPLRLSAQVDGEIPTGENLDQPLLTLRVRNSPRPLPSGSVRESEWEGMSGATVFSGDNLLVGVITEHHLPEGESALTAVPITAIDQLPQAEATKWWKLLGVGHQALVRLPVEAPSSLTLSTHPESYIPIPRNPLFQPRPEEFEHLERLLLESRKENSPPRLGLVGMGGVGKSQLAIQLAYRFQKRFPAGIFWTAATGISLSDWQDHFAELSLRTEYLPSNDDLTNPKNVVGRARHFCRYLAEHTDALLILDNVEDPNLVLSFLPDLAGKEPACAILYTSRNTLPPPGITPYLVELLPEDAALRLLLETTRSKLLAKVLANHQDEEADAARFICQKMGYLPLALVHLRGLLVRDQTITLVRLAEVLEQRGALDLAKTRQGDAAPLFETFRLSWERIQQESAQRLFKLACFFPEATPIPRWLLGLAAGFGESGDIFEPLGQALSQLQDLSLIEELSSDQIRVHPLVREFGLHLLAVDTERLHLLSEAGKGLLAEFADMNKLEMRALVKGYWGCLSDVQEAVRYARILQIQSLDLLEHVASSLASESSLLGSGDLWPNKIPGLFYQQLANHATEEGISLLGRAEPARWLKRIGQIGAENHPFQHELQLPHRSAVTSVAFSPDGRSVLTGCQDGRAYLWNLESEQAQRQFKGHRGSIERVAFSFDGRLIVISSGETARIWDVMSGQTLQVLRDHTGIYSVAFSHDGKRVATTSINTARVWDIASGDTIARLPDRTATRGASEIVFLQNAQEVATCTLEGIVRLWNIESQQVVAEWDLQNYSDKALSLSSDGRYLMVGAWNYVYRLDVQRRKGERPTQISLTLPEDSFIPRPITFSPSGAYIAIAVDVFETPVVEIWKWQTEELWCAYKSPGSSLTFSPDDTQLATSSGHSVRIWTLPSTPRPGSLTPDSWSMYISQNGRRLVTISYNSQVQIWDIATGGLLKRLHLDTKSYLPGWVAAISSNGEQIALVTYTSTRILLWDVERNRAQMELVDPDPHQVNSLAFSPDGRMVAAGLSTGAVRIWNLRTQQIIATLPEQLYPVMYPIIDVAFSPDGSRIFARFTDGTAMIWDAIHYIRLAVFPGKVMYLSVSPNGKGVATWGDDRIELWSERDGVRLGVIRKYTKRIERICFSPDNRFLAASNVESRLMLWKVEQPEHALLLGIYSAHRHIDVIHWQDSQHLVLVGRGEHPYIYRLELAGAWE
jgi:WD40 repeat protein